MKWVRRWYARENGEIVAEIVAEGFLDDQCFVTVCRVGGPSSAMGVYLTLEDAKREIECWYETHYGRARIDFKRN